MRSLSVATHKRRRGEWIDRAVFAANAEEHQLGVVVELHAEPIPADLIAFQLVREKFVVHPGEAGDFDGFAAQSDRSIRREAREGDVVRCVAGTRGLLADAVLALNHGRLLGLHGESQFELWIDRLERLLVAVPLNLPVAVPDSSVLGADSCDGGPGTIRAFGVEEVAAVEIAKREMREIEVAHVPGIRLRCVAIYALSKKGQFKTKVTTVGGSDVAGVIPPFGLIIGMIEMVARKFVAVSGQCDSVLRTVLCKARRGGERK